MCISAWEAEFSSTITGTCEVLVDGRINHVLWYQNTVGGGKPKSPEWRTEGKGNCLLIPLLGSWESIRLLNTADTPRLLKDVDRALQFPVQQLANSLPVPGSLNAVSQGRSGGRIAFVQFDVYDVLLAECADDVPGLLPQIQERKRPEVNASVFDTFADWYRSPVAVCCFNTEEQAEAKPLGFAFEPRDPEHLLVYTLDGHDGKAPNPNVEAQLDHTVFVGSYLTSPEFGTKPAYHDKTIPPHLHPYLTETIMGTPLYRTMRNGDIVFNVDEVRRGMFHGKRVIPQYGPQRAEEPRDRVFRSEKYLNGRTSYHWDPAAV